MDRRLRPSASELFSLLIVISVVGGTIYILAVYLM
jgi:hypothetical protein